MRIEEGFQPIPFSETNVYLEDPVLPSLLRRLLPAHILRDVQPDLQRLGRDVLRLLRPLADSAAVSPPTVVQYDQWGKRIDNLETSEGWRKLKALAQQEGIPGIFYERTYGEHSRLYGFAKLLMMVGDTQEVFCPSSMTDGAARIIELLENEDSKREVLPRLTSRDPAVAWTAGQWMTERPGGSDVSLTETKATDLDQPHPYGPKYSLSGIKWFSSATDSAISLALARTGPTSAGSRALSLFLVPLRLPLFPDPAHPSPSPVSNNIYIHRLKNKIGTHALPTAELSLQGAEAYLISPLNQGVKYITPVLNITRLWSSVTSVGHLRKCLSIATSYAQVRAIRSGTQLLADSPIHVAALAKVNVLYRALAHMTFGAVRLMGRVECETATESERARLRMLTPVVKAFCADKAVAGVEEAMTAMGGAGYIEENGFGRAIRDGLAEKIWEGTVTVLALDLARSAKDHVTLVQFTSWALSVIDSIPFDYQLVLAPCTRLVQQSLNAIQNIFTPPMHPLTPRPALILIGYITSSIFLLEHAVWAVQAGEPTCEADVEAFRRWVLDSGFGEALDDLRKTMSTGAARVAMDKQLVFGGNAGRDMKTKL